MKLILEKQIWHAVAAALMLWVAGIYAASTIHLQGSFLGLSASFWFWAGLWLGIAHQAFVMLVWRSQLHFGWISARFGPAGFRNYGRGFAFFSFTRLLSVFSLGIATASTLDANRTLLTAIALIFTALVVWLMYSVLNYFSIERALGADHFDEKYRQLGLVRGGIFNYVRNGMYIVGLLVLWLPGLYFASQPALLQGLLAHAFIWPHYFFTEKPDMARIYGDT